MADGIQGTQLVGKLVEPAPEVLTFVGPDGEDLRSYIVELNQTYADSVVARNRAVPVIQELQRIYNEVQEKGVSRSTMEALQHIGDQYGLRGPAFESAVPMNHYTERRSLTNQRPALEAVGGLTVGLIAAAGAAAIYLLYKMIKWLIKMWRERGDKNKEASASATKAASGVDGVLADPKADSIMQRISNSSKSGEVADLVLETFSVLVKGFGDLPGGNERELGAVTNQIDSYMDKCGQFFDKVRAITDNLSHEKALSDADIAKIDSLCKEYANPLTTGWPAWNGFLRAYGVSVETRRLAATGVNVDDVDKATTALKKAMEADGKKSAINSRKFAKNEMQLVQKLLKAISKNLEPSAGYFPDMGALEKYLEERAKSVEAMTKDYDAIRKEPKPESAVGLAHLADLNQLCSIWGKLLVDYATLTQYLLARITAFTAACNRYLTVYTDTVNGKSDENNKSGKPEQPEATQ